VEVISEFAPLGDKYPYGTVLFLEAVPGEDRIFSHWGGHLTGRENPTGISIDGTKNIIAYFPEIIFEENFSCQHVNDIPSEWDSFGVNDGANWSVVDSNLAGGNNPELRFSYSPTFSGSYSSIESPLIDCSGYSWLELSFKHYVKDITGDGGYFLAVYLLSNGWNLLWEISPTKDVGPETVIIDLSDFDGEELSLVWDFYGDSYEIDYWYLDDILLTGY